MPDGELAVIEVANDEGRDSALRLRAHVSDCNGLVHLVAQVRRLFDLDADPEIVDPHLARNPTFRKLVRRNRGLRVPGTVDPVEIGVRAILGQQVSIAAATTFAGRLVERYGTSVTGLEALGLTALFPTAARLATAPLDDIGITSARGNAIRAFAGSDVPLDGSIDLAELVRRLQGLPGIGEWTAHYIAMRGAGERDAIPASDLGLRHTLGDSRAEVLTATIGLRPWRAYAAMHVWCATASIARSSQRPAQTRQTA